MPTYEEFEKEKMRSTDRVLVLEKIEGQNTLTDKGQPDNRLFTGDNKVHLVKEEQTGLWCFKLDSGGLPETLKQKFTTFKAISDFARVYYKRRGLIVKEILE